MAGARLILLLPEGAAFGAQRLDANGARALGRADVLTAGETGRRAQLLRHLRPLPAHWPIAALTRAADAGVADAADALWLRADPCHVRPDINGARLLAHGEALRLTRQDVDAFLPALRPLFGDLGMPIDAPVPSRWYLRLPRGARLPVFSSPADALGGDVFEHLAEGDEGRRWRALLSEAQIVLHNHPHNAARAARGLATVNSLWFWGAGVLPDSVAAGPDAFASEDESARALAHAAGVMAGLPARLPDVLKGAVAFDLDGLRDLRAFTTDWFGPALEALRGGSIASLAIDCADGRRFAFTPMQRWRFWRRPRARFDA